MNNFTAPFNPPVSAPEMARRLAMILAGLAAVVARRFLRDPKLMALTVPLCGWLSRSAQRFLRAMTRPVVVRAARVGRTSDSRARGLRLPSRRAWLVRALGWEVAGYGSQLEHLLAEPEMQGLMTAVPAIGRILRPLCRMLGVAALPVAPVVAVGAEVAATAVGQPSPLSDAAAALPLDCGVGARGVTRG